MKLTTINNLLLTAIVIVNGYIIAAPLLPQIIFYFENKGDKRQRLEALAQPKKAPNKNNLASQPNHVIIPSMLLDQPLHEGPVSQAYQVLNQGIWRWPNGSTPDKGSNTVLIGHRFTYTNPHGVFYYLNKVKVNDTIGLIWNHQAYSYRVSSITVVPPTDTSIENGSTKPELTLFTCTPLWLPKNRLVVVANLETKL